MFACLPLTRLQAPDHVIYPHAEHRQHSVNVTEENGTSLCFSKAKDCLSRSSSSCHGLQDTLVRNTDQSLYSLKQLNSQMLITGVNNNLEGGLWWCHVCLLISTFRNYQDTEDLLIKLKNDKKFHRGVNAGGGRFNIQENLLTNWKSGSYLTHECNRNECKLLYLVFF